jgi:hypothetical protein
MFRATLCLDCSVVVCSGFLIVHLYLSKGSAQGRVTCILVLQSEVQGKMSCKGCMLIPYLGILTHQPYDIGWLFAGANLPYDMMTGHSVMLEC